MSHVGGLSVSQWEGGPTKRISPSSFNGLHCLWAMASGRGPSRSFPASLLLAKRGPHSYMASCQGGWPLTPYYQTEAEFLASSACHFVFGLLLVPEDLFFLSLCLECSGYWKCEHMTLSLPGKERPVSPEHKKKMSNLNVKESRLTCEYNL